MLEGGWCHTLKFLLGRERSSWAAGPPGLCSEGGANGPAGEGSWPRLERGGRQGWGGLGAGPVRGSGGKVGGQLGRSVGKGARPNSAQAGRRGRRICPISIVHYTGNKRENSKKIIKNPINAST